MFYRRRPAPRRAASPLALSTIALLASGCLGEVAAGPPFEGAPDDHPPARRTPVPPPVGTEVPGVEVVLQRLSLREVEQVLADLFGAAPEEAGRLLPSDQYTEGSAFDNEWVHQDPTEALVVGAEQLARNVASQVFANSWGWVRMDDIAPALPLLERELRLIYGLTK